MMIRAYLWVIEYIEQIKPNPQKKSKIKEFTIHQKRKVSKDDIRFHANLFMVEQNVAFKYISE